MRVLVLFPGGLGDLLCCWPALASLRARPGTTLTLAARPMWLEALPEAAVTPLSIDRREIADLFATSPLAAATRRLLEGHDRVVSWSGHGDANFAARLADAAGAPATVHPFRDFQPGEHASAYYARGLGVAPTLAPLPLRAASRAWADAWLREHAGGAPLLAVHAGSGSASKNWQGMAAVAAAWRADGGRVVALAGPAEDAIDHPADAIVRAAPLDRVAALLRGANAYLGNDSGISHLAGLVGARGVAVFGDSDPRAWAPLGGGVRVLHGAAPCRACGPRQLCVHRVTAAAVLAAVREATVAGSAPEA